MTPNPSAEAQGSPSLAAARWWDLPHGTCSEGYRAVGDLPAGPLSLHRQHVPDELARRCSKMRYHRVYTGPTAMMFCDASSAAKRLTGSCRKGQLWGYGAFAARDQGTWGGVDDPSIGKGRQLLRLHMVQQRTSLQVAGRQLCGGERYPAM